MNTPAPTLSPAVLRAFLFCLMVISSSLWAEKAGPVTIQTDRSVSTRKSLQGEVTDKTRNVSVTRDGVTDTDSSSSSVTRDADGDIRSIETNARTERSWDLGGGDSAGDDSDTPAQDQGGVSSSIKIYETKTEGDVALWETGGKTETSWDGGSGSLTGDLKVGQAGGDYGGKVSFDDGFQGEGNIQGEVNLIKVETGGAFQQDTGLGTVKGEVKGTGTVGMDGEVKGQVTLGPDGVAVSAGADVFTGAKLEGVATGTWDLQDLLGIAITGTVKGEVTAGAGAHAGADFAITDDKITIGADLGATLGLGTGGEGSIEIDITRWTDWIRGQPDSDIWIADWMFGSEEPSIGPGLTLPPSSPSSGGGSSGLGGRSGNRLKSFR